MNIRQTIRAELRARYPALAGPPKLPAPPKIDRTAIVLGRDERRASVLLPLKARLEHCFILGATGSGKSRMLSHMMRQAVAHGEGLCFVDPHGTDDYKELLLWLSERDTTVHVIDFNAPNVVGFNPLACPADTDPSVIVGNFMDALSVSWEGESLAQKPTIERVMSAMLAALVELKLTICEAPHILDHADSRGLRRYAIEHVQDDFTRSVLIRLQELSEDIRRKRDFDQEVVGPENRLARLLRPPTIRAMLGQTENCLDFKAIMDGGEVLLANLSGGTKVYEKEADLFGRLLTRTALFHAKRRTNTRPFNLVMDEAHRFLSADIPVLLAEVRKYGVAITAAMQWLAQAEAYDENILAALLNGTNIKICFRLRDAEEAERMAHSIIPLNLERPVEALIKPTVIGHQRMLLNNESDSVQQSTTKSRALALGETRGYAETVADSMSTTRAESHGTSTGESSSDMHSNSEGAGAGDSSSDIMIPTDDPDSPMISRTSAGSSSNQSHSSSHGSSNAKSKGSNHSTSRSETRSQSRATTQSLANSRVETEGEAISDGTGRSKGHSEALEPIMANLPTAVHSMQNELYAAGKLLRSLPRAVGYLSYVGQRGAVATLFTVPLLPEIPQTNFIATRDQLLRGHPPLAAALRVIADRAEALAPARPTPRPTETRRPQSKPSINTDDTAEPSETW